MFSFIFILIISLSLVSSRVFGDITKPTKEIELWTPVQESSCPEIQVPKRNRWRYQDGFRKYRSEIDIDGDDRPDVIEAEDSSGSAEGMTSISLILGSSGEKIDVDYQYSFEFFLSETNSARIPLCPRDF